jgi:glycine hydroxymethyltransferase
MAHEEFGKKLNSAVFPGMQGGPMDHAIAAKAVSFKEALQPEFKTYARQIKVNAKALADSLMENGASLSTEGTDNHLILMDISIYGVGGKVAETVLDEVGIFTNKNMIPFDTRSPFDPSGIRIGTPALTTRGLGTLEMSEIGELIVKTLKNHDNPEKFASIREQVMNICAKYPFYPGLNY